MRTVSVPFGRLSDYLSKPDADLYLVRSGRGIFDNETLIRFSTRKALEAFSKKNGLRALVPTQVPLNCAVWPFQSDNEARRELDKAKERADYEQSRYKERPDNTEHAMYCEAMCNTSSNCDTL